ncbi:MAG: DinB family protein [Desulfobacterales bacterium]
MIHQTPAALARTIERHLEEVNQLASVLSRAPAETMVGTTWDLRKTVAHLLAWTREFVQEIEFVRDNPGATVPWTITTGIDYSDWNRARIRELADQPYSALVRQWVDEAGFLAATVKNCTADELRNVCRLPWESQKGNIPTIATAWIQHERQHTRNIRMSLGRV